MRRGDPRRRRLRLLRSRADELTTAEDCSPDELCRDGAGTPRELGRASTTTPLFPGQVEVLEITAPADVTAEGNVFWAELLLDPTMPTFRECRDDNNRSDDVEPRCLM